MQVALRFSKTYTHTVSFPPLAVRKYLDPSSPLNLSLHTDRRTLRKVQDFTADGGVRPGGTHSFRPAGDGRASRTCALDSRSPHHSAPTETATTAPKANPRRLRTQDRTAPQKIKGRSDSKQDPTLFPNFQEGERCGRLRGPRVKFKVRAENSWTGQA